jgi:NhaA family Na+:H+ antiporter
MESTEKQTTWSRFFHSEATGSILLLICTLTALIWANSPWSGTYFRIVGAKVGFAWNDSKFLLSFNHWINDGLMAIFFFVVGLELKREIVVGQLSTIKKAVLPAAAALGGMVAPGLIYFVLNSRGESMRGWAIPMATDIAFALGILALLGPRVPKELKVFLAALAIADDLGSVLVIALFYTDRLYLGPLFADVIFLGLLMVASRLKVRSVFVYSVLVAGVWFGVFASGIHATVAGVLVAMVVPVRSRIESESFFTLAREQLDELETGGLRGAKLKDEQIEALERLQQTTSKVVPAGLAFERYLHPVTAYVILPLFALFNAGIVLDRGINDMLRNGVFLGILLGLVAGKQAGITLGAWFAVRFRLAALPDGISWNQIHACSVLAGIGFTMALFISDLAFTDQHMIASAKLAILTASVVCAGLGYLLLRRTLLKRPLLRQVRPPVPITAR